MKPIFLLGFMGCGKSTLGRNVAAIMHIPFIDLDIFIEQRFHRNVREIFAERGEDGFRQIERNVLHEVGDFEDTIIACPSSSSSSSNMLAAEGDADLGDFGDFGSTKDSSRFL